MSIMRKFKVLSYGSGKSDSMVWKIRADLSLRPANGISLGGRKARISLENGLAALDHHIGSNVGILLSQNFFHSIWFSISGANFAVCF